MKYAADFRRIARDGLRGQWMTAVAAAVIASLLGVIELGGPKLKFELTDGNFHGGLQIAGQDILSFDGIHGIGLAGIATTILVAAILIGVARFILGAIMGIGYDRFHLDIVDRRMAEIGTMFGYFAHWKTAACARLLQGVYVLLWSLLLIVPGIMAAYSYAMTGYILAENPELTASEAIARSKNMMFGNRWRLFCMQFSFIGWEILSALLTFGIGALWIAPYKQSATAAFYREISGTNAG